MRYAKRRGIYTSQEATAQLRLKNIRQHLKRIKRHLQQQLSYVMSLTQLCPSLSLFLLVSNSPIILSSGYFHMFVLFCLIIRSYFSVCLCHVVFLLYCNSVLRQSYFRFIFPFGCLPPSVQVIVMNITTFRMTKMKMWTDRWIYILICNYISNLVFITYLVKFIFVFPFSINHIKLK